MLRRLLSPRQYAMLREEITDRALFPTRDARLAERERLKQLTRERERESQIAAELAVIAEREAKERERQVALRQTEALRRLTPLLAVRPWSVSDAVLSSLIAADESEPIVARVRDEVWSWFDYRETSAPLPRPDAHQVDVVRTIQAPLLVQARAGSGKTRALIYRALFLVECCGVRPDEILIMAFNRKAADEIRSRLDAAGATMPHVMTLHALARALANPTQQILVDDDAQDERGALGMAISAIVSRMTENPTIGPKVRALMMGIARNVLADVDSRGLNESADAGLAWRRALAIEALDGTRTRTIEEKRVLDFLLEHDLPHRYRQVHRVKGDAICPLATLSGEHGRVIVDLRGSDLSNDAAQTLERNNFTVVRLQSALGGEFERAYASWAEALSAIGVTTRRLDNNAVWEKLRERARRKFNRLVEQYIGRMRQQGLNDQERNALLARHKPSSEWERLFLELAERAHSEYRDLLVREVKTDFSDVVLTGTRAVEGGRRTWRRAGTTGDVGRVKHILVDEFQDVSPVLMSLVNALCRANREIQTTGIGDDWQAINGFAGASTRFFRQFSDHFPGAVTRSLPTNYRSAPEIVDLGNAIMAGRGAAAASAAQWHGELLLGDLSTLQLTPLELDEESPSRLLVAIKRIVAATLREEGTIAVLSRTRSPVAARVLLDGDEGWKSAVHAGLTAAEARRVHVSTVHQFKGREATTVILADASDSSFPMIHGSWPLFRIFGDSVNSLVDDERRLLYVAVTRAARRLVCLVDSWRGDTVSPLFGHAVSRFETLRWADYPPVQVEDASKCVITVSNIGKTQAQDEGTFPIKNLLMSEGYKYSTDPEPQWAKVVRVSAQSIEEIVADLQQCTWARTGKALLVEIAPTTASAQRFFVSDGRWSRF
ncbi:MAG: DEAD/DEAH box helicase [Gemmatimonadetes bacterium]|nr:DEAD/DEAH box helicase [Gemmatimonadota bacterium]